MQSALREMRLFLGSGRYWATFATVVLLFVVTGPFGTAERLPPALRLGYWLVLHALTWGAALVFVALGDTMLAGVVRHRLARLLGGALAAAPVIGLAVEALNLVTFGEPIGVAGLLESSAIGLVLSGLFCVLTWLAMSARAPHPDATSEPAAALPAPILRRLPPEKRGPVLRLSVQDHYVEVVTERGRDLVLMRFSDALDELGDAGGLRIHRSHWLADAAVDGLSREDGRPVVRLRSGGTLPVSRPYLSAARARWKA